MSRAVVALHQKYKRHAPDSLPKGPLWMERALCRQHDPEIWFPESRGHRRERQQEFARSVCSTCPVMRQCGDYAEELRAGFYGVVGIWGGKVYGVPR